LSCACPIPASGPASQDPEGTLWVQIPDTALIVDTEDSAA